MANNAIATRQKRALLLTRPRQSANAFLAQLDQDALASVTVIISPLIEIVSTGYTPDLSEFAGMIFTSAHVFDHIEVGKGQDAYCVGAKTAKLAQAHGWNVVAYFETADDLVAHIKASRPPLIHLAGAHRRGEIAARLTKHGTSTEAAVVYDQVALALSDDAQEVLVSGIPVVVPLFSPRSAELFAHNADNLAQTHVFAMSDAVADELAESKPRSLQIARAPTADEMRIGVENLLRRPTLP